MAGDSDGAGYRPRHQPVAAAARPYGGRLRVILGPTNTGKTHLAVERMLGHSSGMIGLPLRLLAREVYDRLVHVKGKGLVALITGEEKIHPPNPAYFVCTVEAMPLERDAAFLAVDEVQLAADPERGHVFTDRILRARGREETMLLGAETMRPLLAKLLPDASFETRMRLSRLSYAGTSKLTRLPRRSALAAFSAADVYGLAELVRRQKGGAAVVMGALSPRTRNAQVALFENREVDYLVATDAIGMGLNLNINHVAFGGIAKFDGYQHRPLRAAEIGQIAGRAGRHMNDGTFGTLAEIGPLAAETVDAIEDHRFPAVDRIQWRSSNVDYSSLEALIAALETPPATDGLVLTRNAEDLQVLKELAADPGIRDLASGPAAVGLLWQVCRLPDFAKVMADVHARLVGRIYRHLMSHDGILPPDWLAHQVTPLDRTDGDVDTLSARLAHIRTWTYIAHRGSWLNDPLHWQELTRDIEDRLSDALHERLTQRFVDRRSAVLMRGLKDKAEILAGVGEDGAVTVEGEYVGHLDGFHFAPDTPAAGQDRALLLKAARRALRDEVRRRAREIMAAPDTAFFFDPKTAHVGCRDRPLARLKAGDDPRRPHVVMMRHELLDSSHGQSIKKHLNGWLQRHIAGTFAPLAPLEAASRGETDASGAVRGLAFQLCEAGGILERRLVARECRMLTRRDRRDLQRLGVTVGRFNLFVPAMLKPAAATLRHALWCVHNEMTNRHPPQADRASIAADKTLPVAYYRAAGYHRLGRWALRVDVLEALLARLAKTETAGFVPAGGDLASVAGLTRTALEDVMQSLGYRRSTRDGVHGYEKRGARAAKPSRRKPRRRRQPRSAGTGTAAATGETETP